MEKKKILFIINPISGTKRKENLESTISQNIDGEKFEPHFEITRYAGNGYEIARNAVNQQIDIVVAVGGDGTINEVSRGIIGSQVIMGIIPLGSGNGLARHLNIPLKTDEAIKVINETFILPIDTVRINNTSFVSIAGVGFDALVAKKFALQKRRGFFSYFKVILTEYLRYRQKKYHIVLDGQTIRTKAFFIALANSDQFGYHTSIAPKARVTDGLIDVVVVQKIPVYQAIFQIPLLFNGKIEKSRFVESYQAKEVEIYRKKNRVINIDGEPVKLERDLEIKIVPKSLKIIVPKNLYI